MHLRTLPLIWTAIVAAVAADPVEWPRLPRYQAMGIPADNPISLAKVDLGRDLFFDTRLSADGGTACASCHDPRHGFTPGPERVQKGRACPTLWNIGYHQAFHWDGSAATLEQAAFGMWRFRLAPGRSGAPGPEEIARRMDAQDEFGPRFRAAFDGPASIETIPKALAAFLRTLVAERSAWTRFREGEREALSERARAGWALFDGKAGCTTCHNGALLTDQQFHNVGIGMDAEKPDHGRWNVTRLERDRGAFKTPTLLNVSRTAPYFHDGSVATLADAVDVMADGGIPNRHLDAALGPVELSRADRDAILAFLEELTVDFVDAPPEVRAPSRR